MSIIMSQDVKGELTHWINPEHKDLALKGESPPTKEMFNKPAGIWLSWNRGWERWCENNEAGWLDNKICLNARLNPGLKLWQIDSIPDFHEQCPKEGGITDLPIPSSFWEQLKKKGFDGIALTENGQSETRMNTWLYG